MTQPSESSESSASLNAGIPAAPIRVLIADDSEDVVDSMSLLMQAMGYDVRTALDGHGALEVADAFRPQAALLDIGLPGLDGYDVARALRQRDYGAGLLLIAVTGWGQDEQRRMTKDAGFDHHFVKPVLPRDIKPVIDAHFLRPATG